MDYTCTHEDLNVAWAAARKRRETNYDIRQEFDSLILGFVGTLGEIACSHLSGIEHESLGLERGPYLEWVRSGKADLGPFEIRSTANSSKGFEVKDKDRDDFIGVLMYAPVQAIGKDLYKSRPPHRLPVVSVVGWILISEARKKMVFKNGIFQVLREDLNPPASLQQYFDEIKQMAAAGLREYRDGNKSFKISPL